MRYPWWTASGAAKLPLRMIPSALCPPPISGASPASSRSSSRRPISMPITSASLPPTAQRRGPPTAWRARRSGAGPSTPSTPSGCRTPGLPSSTSPPRRRWRLSPKPRRRTLTRPSAGSVRAIPTSGCPPVPPRFSRSGSRSLSTTERSGKTSHLRLEEGCIGCGRCAANCPVQAIEMQERRPVWGKEKCAMCLGCLHRCPKFAIQYGGNTRRHGQYTHPKTSG